MNNTERREQLARARTNAVSWAEQAEDLDRIMSDYTDRAIAFACMWAQVANSLKVGNDAADA